MINEKKEGQPHKRKLDLQTNKCFCIISFNFSNDSTDLKKIISIKTCLF